MSLRPPAPPVNRYLRPRSSFQHPRYLFDGTPSAFGFVKSAETWPRRVEPRPNCRMVHVFRQVNAILNIHVNRSTPQAQQEQASRCSEGLAKRLVCPGSRSDAGACSVLRHCRLRHKPCVVFLRLLGGRTLLLEADPAQHRPALRGLEGDCRCLAAL